MADKSFTVIPALSKNMELSNHYYSCPEQLGDPNADQYPELPLSEHFEELFHKFIDEGRWEEWEEWWESIATTHKLLSSTVSSADSLACRISGTSFGSNSPLFPHSGDFYPNLSGNTGEYPHLASKYLNFHF